MNGSNGTGGAARARRLVLKPLCLAALLLLFAAPAPAFDEPAVAGFSHEEAMRLGQRMYREGILTSGEPMQAVVMGDIPVDSRTFTCDDCHQRSGLGSEEGTVVTWPINGRYLSEPRRRSGAWRPPETEEERLSGRKALPPQYRTEDVRPAYTDEALGLAIMAGVDPSGRSLDPVMPRYMLDEKDMAVLVYYLRNLNAETSPGVDETTIRFATVVAGDVPPDRRTAMLSALQAHIDARNSQSRHEERRSKWSPFYKTEMYQAYRRLELDVWELTGPEETWRTQLEAYYRARPVFALLGGISAGGWAPVHEFCEKNEIPALFPVTDLPVISGSDWFTLYFSKGLYQEGEAAARYLYSRGIASKGGTILQIYRKDARNSALARGFEDAWAGFGMPEAISWAMEEGEELRQEALEGLVESHRPSAVLLWVNREDMAAPCRLAGAASPPEMFFASWSQMGEAAGAFPAEMLERTYFTYPYILPEEVGKRMDVVKAWLRARDIPPSDLEVQSKMYFLGWMLSGGIKMMRSDFYREHFLEGFDMMLDQDYAIAVYPRLSFGPGQRYASKGCYIVQLTGGQDPKLIKKSGWIIY